MIEPNNENPSPTNERLQQNGGVFAELVRDEEKNAPVKRYRATWECPLDAYRDFGLINAKEYKAGLEFRRIYYATVMCRKMNEHGLVSDEDMQVAKLEGVLKSALRQMPPN